jgi:hypothetical protein
VSGDALLFYAPYAQTPYDYYASRIPHQTTPVVIDDAYARTPAQPALATRLPCSTRVWLVLSHDHENGDTLGVAVVSARPGVESRIWIGAQDVEQMTA